MHVFIFLYSKWRCSQVIAVNSMLPLAPGCHKKCHWLYSIDNLAFSFVVHWILMNDFVIKYHSSQHLSYLNHLGGTHMCQWTRPSVVHIMPGCVFSAKPSYGLLLVEPLGTVLGEVKVEMRQFSHNKISLKKSSTKWRPQCANSLWLSDAIWWQKYDAIWRHIVTGNGLLLDDTMSLLEHQRWLIISDVQWQYNVCNFTIDT